MDIAPRTIALVGGTRPEAVKLAPLALELRRRRGARCVVVSTGQHREMFGQALAAFGLAPDVDLGLMAPRQTPAELAGRTLLALPAALAALGPVHAAVVQGDTATAFAGAVAAFYSGVAVAHVEAGLRTGDLASPFPEEANRKMIAAIARWHFAPTERARTALLAEGVADERIAVTGNTGIDALRWMADHPPDGAAAPCAESAHQRAVVLVTMHRRENHGPGLIRLCEALLTLARRHRDRLRLVYPVHPNPSVSGPVLAMLGDEPNIELIAPLDYPRFVAAMKASRFVISDSGGVQEEAPALGKPVLVTRDTTERPEALEAGGARLVGTDAALLLEAAEELLTDGDTYRRMAMARSPYGDGHASERIADILLA